MNFMEFYWWIQKISPSSHRPYCRSSLIQTAKNVQLKTKRQQNRKRRKEQVFNFLSENYLQKPRKQNIVWELFHFFVHFLGLQRIFLQKRKTKNKIVYFKCNRIISQWNISQNAFVCRFLSLHLYLYYLVYINIFILYYKNIL